MTKGKFIVFYGINRLGKTTQLEIVSKEIEVRNSISVLRLKYPLYNSEPTGPRINAYLRRGNPENLTPFQHQELQLQNRLDYQPTLIERLESGLWVLAEDYVLTGIAWGVATGVDESWLKKETEKLLKEDLGILFDGKQFLYREPGHLYENDENLTQKCKEIHLRLANERGIQE
jgi:dTMP kinase